MRQSDQILTAVKIRHLLTFTEPVVVQELMQCLQKSIRSALCIINFGIDTK